MSVTFGLVFTGALFVLFGPLFWSLRGPLNLTRVKISATWTFAVPVVAMLLCIHFGQVRFGLIFIASVAASLPLAIAFGTKAAKLAVVRVGDRPGTLYIERVSEPELLLLLLGAPLALQHQIHLPYWISQETYLGLISAACYFPATFALVVRYTIFRRRDEMFRAHEAREELLRSGDAVDVILADAGPQRVAVIKAIREIVGLGLIESKWIVDNVPRALKEGVTGDEAKTVVQRLEAAGARIEIGGSSPKAARSF